MKSKFNEKAAIEMAYFRFSLIAPVIQGTFTDPSKTAYYRRVTENTFSLPNGKTMIYNPKTLEKWEEYYRKRGMDGLMPHERSDSGQTRVLDENVIAEIHQLKESLQAESCPLFLKLASAGFLPRKSRAGYLQYHADSCLLHTWPEFSALFRQSESASFQELLAQTPRCGRVV